MANFKYDLQNVLEIREKLEDMKQKEYAKALHLLEEERKVKEQINQSLDKNQNILRKNICSTIDPVQIKQRHNYQKHLKSQYKIAVQNVDKAKVTTEKQRKELLEAMKDKKTLEILKEKKFEQFLEEEKKIEQQIIDEIVSFAYTKNE